MYNSNYNNKPKQNKGTPGSKLTEEQRKRTNPFSAVRKPVTFNNDVNSGSSLSDTRNPTQSTSITTKRQTSLFGNGENDAVINSASPFIKTRRREYEDDTKSILVIPKKHKPNYEQDHDKAQQKRDSLDKKIKLMKNEAVNSDNKVNCPFCYAHFPFVSKVVQNALDVIETKNKQYKQKVKAAEEDSVFYKPDTLIHRPIPKQEKQDFCKLHRIEFIFKPEAIKKGYPTSIQYLLLDQRVQKLKSELIDIINGDIHSDYRDIALKAYEEMGTNKARTSHALMARFEDVLPGYYGPKGGAILLDVLANLFLDLEILTAKKAAPQLPQEYIQQVLVPETVYRLIKEDMKLDDDKEAKKVMKESVEYGEVMNPLIEDV